jgi:hypothetical protein
MTKKLTPKKTAINASFPVYCSAKLLAQVVWKARENGFEGKKVSPLLRDILEAFAGAEEDWTFETSDMAVEYLKQEGFDLKQFSKPGQRWFRGKGREDLFETRSYTPTPALDQIDHKRLDSIMQKLLAGDTLTTEEQEEYKNVIQGSA